MLMTRHEKNESQCELAFHRVSVPMTQERKVRTGLPPLLIIIAIALAVYLATRFL